jgi:hypothetical protein
MITTSLLRCRNRWNLRCSRPMASPASLACWSGQSSWLPRSLRPRYVAYLSWERKSSRLQDAKYYIKIDQCKDTNSHIHTEICGYACPDWRMDGKPTFIGKIYCCHSADQLPSFVRMQKSFQDTKTEYRDSMYQKKGLITNDDLLYTLSLFALEPVRWIERYEWRKMTPMEICAM